MDSQERRNLLAPELSRWTREQGPLLRLEGVSKRFGGHSVLSNLDLTVEAGSSLVVLGRSGSGKSVLLKLMNGLLMPDEGRVVAFGIDTARASRAELMQLRKRTATLFQNYALFDSMTVLENVMFPLVENTAMPRATLKQMALELLELLAIPHAAQLFPAELSGGMKKRVSLARAIITNPECVLFDEPTTGLDPVMIEFVDDLLIDVQRRFHLTSVIISHDMASAFRLADHLAMLHEGRISFWGTPDETKACEREEVRSFVAIASSRLGDHAPQELAHVEDAAATPGTRGTPAPAGSDDAHGALRFEDLPTPDIAPLVVVRDVVKAFGSRTILHGVSFFVEPRRITTLIGGSGSGKTVMMKHILGLLRADAGSVSVFGQELSALSERDLLRLRLRMGMLFQSAALFDSMSVQDNLAFPLREQPGRSLSEEQIRDRVLDVLEKLRIPDLARKMPSDVSGGQRKRIGLARAIVANPDMMIFDEPTTGLDPVMTAYVNDMIVEAQETFDLTALIVSHDMASTFRISHKVAMLYQGRIIAFGTPQELLQMEHPRVREFIYAGSL